MVPEGAGGDWARRRRRDAALETVVGATLIVLVALGGLYLFFRPASGAVDAWFLELIGGSKSRYFSAVTSLRYPWVVVVGSVVTCAATLFRDLPRALACLVGPPVALVACELVAKPLVGRTLGGSLSYPSGSTVGAAALACVAVLATPPAWRGVAVTVASVFALWMTLAVIALGWHYPTDALAGLAMGAGTVLVADGLAYAIGEALAHARRGRQGPPSVRKEPTAPPSAR